MHLRIVTGGSVCVFIVSKWWSKRVGCNTFRRHHIWLLSVTFETEQKFFGIRLTTATAMHAGKRVFLCVVLVEDLWIGKYGHDLGREDGRVRLDLAVVVFVNFARTLVWTNGDYWNWFITIELYRKNGANQPYVGRLGIFPHGRWLNANRTG